MPRFCEVLRRKFKSPFAFYFWASREGRPPRSHDVPREPMRLVAVYPRRPKVFREGQEQVMKINAELFSAAADFRRFGIPTFAACPCATSIFDFADKVEFLWFALRGDGKETDLELEIGCLRKAARVSPIEGPISDERACQIVSQESRPLAWDEAIEAIRYVRKEKSDRRTALPFLPGYRPVFFLA